MPGTGSGVVVRIFVAKTLSLATRRTVFFLAKGRAKRRAATNLLKYC
jgi:hypothetical protein